MVDSCVIPMNDDPDCVLFWTFLEILTRLTMASGNSLSSSLRRILDSMDKAITAGALEIVNPPEVIETDQAN